MKSTQKTQTYRLHNNTGFHQWTQDSND